MSARHTLFIPPLKGEGRREAAGWGRGRHNKAPTTPTRRGFAAPTSPFQGEVVGNERSA